MHALAGRPIAEGLFTWPSDAPALLGSRCRDCGRASFPAQAGCPACCGSDIAVEELPRHGTLWSWTIQRIMPKSPYATDETPASFRAFGVGYVELPGAVRVEARLTEGDPDRLRIGMPMELVFLPLRREADGTDVISFAFRPA